MKNFSQKDLSHAPEWEEGKGKRGKEGGGRKGKGEEVCSADTLKGFENLEG